jgi:hypothetical protein
VKLSKESIASTIRSWFEQFLLAGPPENLVQTLGLRLASPESVGFESICVDITQDPIVNEYRCLVVEATSISSAILGMRKFIQDGSGPELMEHDTYVNFVNLSQELPLGIQNDSAWQNFASDTYSLLLLRWSDYIEQIYPADLVPLLQAIVLIPPFSHTPIPS